MSLFFIFDRINKEMFNKIIHHQIHITLFFIYHLGFKFFTKGHRGLKVIFILVTSIRDYEEGQRIS